MSYRRRIYFTSEQKSEIWDRWQRGESMSSIGRGFDWDSSSIYPLLSRAGAIAAARDRAIRAREREVEARYGSARRANYGVGCIGFEQDVGQGRWREL